MRFLERLDTPFATIIAAQVAVRASDRFPRPGVIGLRDRFMGNVR